MSCNRCGDTTVETGAAKTEAPKSSGGVTQSVENCAGCGGFLPKSGECKKCAGLNQKLDKLQQARQAQMDHVESAVIGLLRAERDNLGGDWEKSDWEKIEKCLSDTVQLLLCTRMARRLWVEVQDELGPYENHKWGFDTTDFGNADRWNALLEWNDIEPEPTHEQDGWHWKGPQVEIVTQYNPCTGEHYRYPNQSNRMGLVGYIGIEGEKYTVANLTLDIREMAEVMKDESKDERGFI